MCLNIFSYRSHPDYKLIIAANRDEFYVRKTQEAHFWKDHPGLLGGRDLEHGGTWLGINKQGKFSFITNYRDPKAHRQNSPSRGALVSDYLTGSKSPSEYLSGLGDPKNYNGYNLVVGDMNEVCHFSNVEGKINKLDPGLYGLSNGLLDTPWKKLVSGKKEITEIIGRKNFEAEDLFVALYNEVKADDAELPSTGIPYEMEKLVSSVFIKSDVYGTVCSTVVLVDNDNKVRFFERTYNPLKENKTVSFEFIIS
jgi:uncharacterized protein with NRDE domain